MMIMLSMASIPKTTRYSSICGNPALVITRMCSDSNLSIDLSYFRYVRLFIM